MKIRLAQEKDAKAIAKVHVDSWRTTYEGVVDPDFLANMSYSEREENWSRIIPSNPPLVAENEDGEIIGFASSGPERSGEYPGYSSELYAIYICKEYQGKGLGKSLVSHTMDRLLEAGYESMIVIVLEENEARFFYEALGGQRLAEGELKIGERTHRELVYGWKSLGELKV